MKAILLMFDSLNRHMLEPYGCTWSSTPNFRRLAKHSVTFDRCYAGSLPCMPARRELQTGRYNFLHRSWGPIEPYDLCMPELLKQNDVYTHLISDHGHYWEDGGATYHQRYSSWEIVRGQEGDHWKTDVSGVQSPAHYGKADPYDEVNRCYLKTSQEMPLQQVYGLGMEFLEKNADADNWFLQIESFDPHEPFYTTPDIQATRPDNYEGPRFDWPAYGKVQEPEQAVAHCRHEYSLLLEECDRCVGRVLDFMDTHDMWTDTMLIVNTDHGFLLGEHCWWGKGLMPLYEEITHLPLFIWDPRSGKQGVRRESLVQTIDLAPTLLQYFKISPPAEMQGHDLRKVIESDEPVRQYALFGMHGRQVSITDGRYVYMRGSNPENQPLHEYTLMPTHMRSLFHADELRNAVLTEPFSFTQKMPLLKIPVKKVGNVNGTISQETFCDLLFDLKSDPNQNHPLQNEVLEQTLLTAMHNLLEESDAPREQFIRLRLEKTDEERSDSVCEQS